MRKPNLILLIVALNITASLCVFYKTQFQNNAAEATTLPEGLGAAVAEEATKLVGNQGKVVLNLPQRGNYKDPTVALQQSAFTKTLARNKGMSLAATESLETERPGTMGRAGWTRSNFANSFKGTPGPMHSSPWPAFPNSPRMLYRLCGAEYSSSSEARERAQDPAAGRSRASRDPAPVVSLPGKEAASQGARVVQLSLRSRHIRQCGEMP